MRRSSLPSAHSLPPPRFRAGSGTPVAVVYQGFRSSHGRPRALCRFLASHSASFSLRSFSASAFFCTRCCCCCCCCCCCWGTGKRLMCPSPSVSPVRSMWQSSLRCASVRTFFRGRPSSSLSPCVTAVVEARAGAGAGAGAAVADGLPPAARARRSSSRSRAASVAARSAAAWARTAASASSRRTRAMLSAL